MRISCTRGREHTHQLTNQLHNHRGIMPMFSQGFGSFIDNYILLLAARFDAPLDAVALCEGDQSQSWEKVARCVRDTLAHPQTDDERREVEHVDVSLFDAQVCRGRALYFRWRLHESSVAAAAAVQPKPHVESNDKIRRKNNDRAIAPSAFDITRDSLKDEVEKIYSAVRMNLPNTLGLCPADNGEEQFCTVVEKDMNSNNDGGDGGLKNANNDDDDVIDPVNIRLRSNEEVVRDRVIAEARDALLTRVQEMQAEFFAQYKRWVDVPLDMEITPTAKKASDGDKPELFSASQKHAIHEPLSKSAILESFAAAVSSGTPSKEKKTPTTSGNKDGTPQVSSSTRLFEALKRQVQVSRPPRPSQMLDEDYVREYGEAFPAGSNEMNIAGGIEFSAYPNRENVDVPRTLQQHDAPTNGASESNARVLNTRANRWNVVEYDGEADEESENMD